MRITEVQAVLFESLDPADDAVPDGGLDVIVALTIQMIVDIAFHSPLLKFKILNHKQETL